MMELTREQAFAEGVVTISRLLLSALSTAGVSPARLMEMIDAHPDDTSMTGKGWRTTLKARSFSRSACPDGALIEGLPADMPHVSGYRNGIFVLATYIQYTDDVRFYGSSQGMEHVLLKGVSLPQTAMVAMAGKPLHEVIAHPSLREDHPVTVVKARRVSDGTAIDIDTKTNRVILHPIHGEIAIEEPAR